MTNALEFLSRVDSIIMLEDGKIIAKGTYEELLNNCYQFKSFIESHLTEKENHKTVQENELKKKRKKLKNLKIQKWKAKLAKRVN